MAWPYPLFDCPVSSSSVFFYLEQNSSVRGLAAARRILLQVDQNLISGAIMLAQSCSLLLEVARRIQVLLLSLFLARDRLNFEVLAWYNILRTNFILQILNQNACLLLQSICTCLKFATRYVNLWTANKHLWCSFLSICFYGCPCYAAALMVVGTGSIRVIVNFCCTVLLIVT